MRRWRPLSSSRSRNVISSPQATRVAFVSPFRIPSSCGEGGTRGQGLNCNENPLILRSTVAALFSFPLRIASAGRSRVNKILLCTLASSLVYALPFHRRLLSRLSPLSPYLALRDIPSYRSGDEESRSLLSAGMHPARLQNLCFLPFNYLVRFKFAIIDEGINRGGYEEADEGKMTGRQSRLYLTILYCFYYYILL